MVMSGDGRCSVLVVCRWNAAGVGRMLVMLPIAGAIKVWDWGRNGSVGADPVRQVTVGDSAAGDGDTGLVVQRVLVGMQVWPVLVGLQGSGGGGRTGASGASGLGMSGLRGSGDEWHGWAATRPPTVVVGGAGGAGGVVSSGRRQRWCRWCWVGSVATVASSGDGRPQRQRRVR